MAANADPFTAFTAKQPLLVELAKFDSFPHVLELDHNWFCADKKNTHWQKTHEKMSRNCKTNEKNE